MARTKKQRIATEFLSLLYRPPLAAGRIHPAFQGGLEKGKGRQQQRHQPA
mgnify:CR=1 FL=1